MRRLSGPSSVLPTRTGFTLVELLVAIAVIAIIGGMVTIAVAGANASAKLVRSRSQIDRMNLLMLQLYEEASERNIAAPIGPVRQIVPPPTQPYNAGDLTNIQTVATENRGQRNSRLLALLNWKRDYLRCSFPDRITDIETPPVTCAYEQFNVPNFTVAGRTAHLIDSSGLPTPASPPVYVQVTDSSVRLVAQTRFQDRVIGLIEGNKGLTGLDFGDCIDGSDANGEWTTENESAECLYLIMSLSVINDRPLVETLKGREVADTDEDGVPEIIDPWGNPVGFIRWPSGLELHPEWNVGASAPYADPITDADLHLQRNSPPSPDPLDILNVDPRLRDTSNASYRADDTTLLVPIIVSAGSDGDFDMVGLDEPVAIDYTATQFQNMIGYSGSSFSHTLNFTSTLRFVDPYLRNTFPTSQRPGAKYDGNEDRADSSGDNVYPVLELN